MIVRGVFPLRLYIFNQGMSGIILVPVLITYFCIVYCFLTILVPFRLRLHQLQALSLYQRFTWKILDCFLLRLTMSLVRSNARPKLQ